MHNKLNDTLKQLISEGWSELQDAGNVLPMRRWGAELITLMTGVFGETTVINILNTLYEEHYKDEDETTDDDDF